VKGTKSQKKFLLANVSRGGIDLEQIRNLRRWWRVRSTAGTYRCAPACIYIEEVTATEPAELPHGNLFAASAAVAAQRIETNASAKVYATAIDHF
jgi:hypothetical protein